jgi:hypothetical protein
MTFLVGTIFAGEAARDLYAGFRSISSCSSSA